MKLKQFNAGVLLLGLFGLSGCSLLPGTGPSYNEVINSEKNSSLQTPQVNLVKLNDPLVQSHYARQESRLLSGLEGMGEGGYSGKINVGDVVEVSIWEAPPAVLFGGTFSSEGQGSGSLTKLPDQTVNSQGTIAIPFVGNINVAGKSPEAVQAMIVSSLQRKANQPQAIVKILNNQSADITVIRQGNSIRMPLTSANEPVLDAISAVGGSPADIQDVTVQLTRGHQVKSVGFEALIAQPIQNIRLRAGDVVSLHTTPYSFTALGAVGTNQQMKFSTKGLTLSEAIGQMGGLLDERSDPRGVFVFRYIPFSELDPKQQQLWASRGYGEGRDIPTVYSVNLLEAQSIFLMQRFPIQNKDIVYVSNAPLAEFQKFLRMIFSLTSPVTGTIRSVQGL